MQWYSYLKELKVAKLVNNSEELSQSLVDEFKEDKVKSINSESLLLIINSPNNPSGTICNNLTELAEVAKKYNIIILSDEIYSQLNFNGKYK